MNLKGCCNCGKLIRYVHVKNDESIGSCNKYSVCPTPELLGLQPAKNPPPMPQVKPPMAVQEPVGWQYYQHSKWWNGDDRIKDHRKNTEAVGIPVRDVYAAPQPAPNTTQLVEALEAVMEFGCDPKSNRGRWALEKAESALTTYRKENNHE